MAVELLPMIATERRRAADLIDSLTPAQLDTPSLCGAWTVRDVAGHPVSPLVQSPWALLPLLVGAGLRPHVANARLARRRSPGELAAALRDRAEHRFRLPVVGWHGQLTGLQVHRQDIRRPLVRGPGEALLLALTGRRVVLADLTGDGVTRLAGH
ncbi:maleylpyruvate isomerase N-terminal domain-containing protein [Micromonospora sp. NPDC050980]|uniref:maleylpyruvate isomerase N-terminal domain-containing protein n=1 Tax=Micromonospora sp. NPDC050980 TaxID=3155161 RepID=UPI0033EDDF5C